MNKKTLVIVESPSKCKKIETYLGKEYKVIASCGHFTKLDSLDQINFDNFTIEYKIDKKKVLKQLKDEIKNSKEVIIATDDDREGEAIGWAICIFCKLDIKKTKKIVFQEITKEALENAMNNIQKINMDRVKSQQTRQILDIYLGYKISPLLWKYIQNKLSAGRCQTPALKLIFDNETEIQNRDFETHYKIFGTFTNKKIKFDGYKTVTKSNIEEFMEKQKEQEEWKITDIKESDTIEKPPKILITSTLQQKSYNTLKFSPKITMKYAQELYENGLITYMRTDSSCYSKDFIEKLKSYIISNHNEQYVNKNIDTLSQNKNKNKSQEAHEGIRVTNLNIKTTTLKNPGANKLYSMIYKHCIECGMSDCENNERKYYITSKDKYKYIYNDKICMFLGWKIMENKKDMNDGSIRYYLNNLHIGDTPLKMSHIMANEDLVKTMLHYNESGLIQSLEKMNIGRPSTFSNIIHSLLDKKYVQKRNIEGNEINVVNYILNEEKEIQTNTTNKTLNSEKNKLQITPLGDSVCKFCFQHFEDLFNYDFTNDMESKLDEIEYGNIKNNSILNEYIKSVNKLLEDTKSIYKNNPEKVSKMKENNSIYCGKYKDDVLYIKHGPYGYYVNVTKAKKISLKDFEGFDIEKKIKEQCNELTSEEYKILVSYIEKSQNKSNENCLITLSNECSIRRSKYGIYIFYKTKSMKKPKFLKYNDEKDDQNEIREKWVEEKNIEHIKEYISKKYNLNI